jgi:hypothetical protein
MGVDMKTVGGVGLALGIATAFLAGPLSAQDSPEKSQKAVAAARTIMALAAENKVNTIWDKHVSTWMKKRADKAVFVQNLSFGRASVGKPTTVKLQDLKYASVEQDYKGDIYSITFETTYKVGKYYERIIVIKDDDGEFRLSGLSSVPGPAD